MKAAITKSTSGFGQNATGCGNHPIPGFGISAYNGSHCCGVTMLGARLFRHPAVVLLSLVVSLSSLAAQSAATENSVAHASSGATSLRIRLRLPDESPFAGSA